MMSSATVGRADFSTAKAFSSQHGARFEQRFLHGHFLFEGHRQRAFPANGIRQLDKITFETAISREADLLNSFFVRTGGTGQIDLQARWLDWAQNSRPL